MFPLSPATYGARAAVGTAKPAEESTPAPVCCSSPNRGQEDALESLLFGEQHAKILVRSAYKILNDETLALTSIRDLPGGGVQIGP